MKSKIKTSVPKIKKKKENLDLFDDVNISDIPEDCLKELKHKSSLPVTSNILELFKLNSGEISLNMLVVAYFRKYEEKVTRKKLNESLAYLKKEKKVQGLGNTFYRYIGE